MNVTDLNEAMPSYISEAVGHAFEPELKRLACALLAPYARAAGKTMQPLFSAVLTQANGLHVSFDDIAAAAAKVRVHLDQIAGGSALAFTLVDAIDAFFYNVEDRAVSAALGELTESLAACMALKNGADDHRPFREEAYRGIRDIEVAWLRVSLAQLVKIAGKIGANGAAVAQLLLLTDPTGGALLKAIDEVLSDFTSTALGGLRR